jgi:hypothetical protein
MDPGLVGSVSQLRCSCAFNCRGPGRCYVDVILDESTGREVVRVKGVWLASRNGHLREESCNGDEPRAITIHCLR